MDKKLIGIAATFVVVMVINMVQSMYNRSQINDIKVKVEQHDSVLVAMNPVLENFNHIMTVFSHYNPETDTNTVNTFIKVVNHFELSSDTIVLNWLIGQICLESSARQYYQSGHKKAGQVIRGTSGEVDITQIMPVTSVGYLKNHVSDETELYELGATDFSFVYNDKNRRANAIEWLSNPTNNIILWGLMTRDNLKANGMLKGLVVYNAGQRGMERFTKRKAAEEHSYIVHLKDTLGDIQEMLGEV